MNTFHLPKIDTRWAANIAALGLVLMAGSAYGDPPVTMAPPVQAAPMQATDGAPGNASADTVFKWSEVPQNQQVPIRRAVFDRGGYQLYDTVGETIVIPFTNQNLYVMKFALSTNGTTYFVNEGSAPVLYVPQNGYLENASVSGARWYPFSEKFHPSHPVFVGLAPSWSVFVGMGWYPHMYYYGGYWGERSFVAGGIFGPSLGLFFEIGGHPYYGWNRYHDYVFAHPAPYHVTVVNNYYDRRPSHAAWSGRSFGGGHSYAAGHSFGGGHVFGGVQTAYAHRTFSSGRTFRGAALSGGSHSFSSRSYSGHSFSGGHSSSGHGGTPHGGTSHGGTSHGGHSFGGSHSHDGGHGDGFRGR